jgi:hypothetical protein
MFMPGKGKTLYGPFTYKGKPAHSHRCMGGGRVRWRRVLSAYMQGACIRRAGDQCEDRGLARDRGALVARTHQVRHGACRRRSASGSHQRSSGHLGHDTHHYSPQSKQTPPSVKTWGENGQVACMRCNKSQLQVHAASMYTEDTV